VEIRYDDALPDIRAVFGPRFVVNAPAVDQHRPARRRLHHDAVTLSDIQYADSEFAGVRVG